MKKTVLVLAGLLLCGIAEAEPDRVVIETIMLEARGESLEGQIAVGEVIRNRALSRGQSFERVCLAEAQFSCWNDKKKAVRRLSKVSGETWQRASAAWAASETSNLTSGATHYFNPRLANPSWAKRLVKTVRIGGHDFFKDS